MYENIITSHYYGNWRTTATVAARHLSYSTCFKVMTKHIMTITRKSMDENTPSSWMELRQSYFQESSDPS